MQLRVVAESDRGLRGEVNEDSVLSALPLVAVADGVGGNNAGEVASAIAVEVLEEWLRTLERRGGKALRDAALDAHRRIHSRAQTDTALRGMATTLTAAWIEGPTCTLAHVGDSRAYLLRDGELRQLTEDQTAVAQLVREGRITPEEAYEHPWRNRLLQALGGQPDVVVDLLHVDLRAGDRLVLASDGLTDALHDDEVRAVLAVHDDPTAAGRALVARAKAAGATDDITVVLVDVTGNGRRWGSSRSGGGRVAAFLQKLGRRRGR